jgi:hypothetical protein
LFKLVLLDLCWLTGLAANRSASMACTSGRAFNHGRMAPAGWPFSRRWFNSSRMFRGNRTDYNNFSQTTDEQKQDYWKKPDVWPDIKAAYERFFQLNPDEVGIYKNYAWYAYHAEQWSEFLRISDQVRPDDYAFFGDKDSFPKMVKYAKEQISSNGNDQNK